MADKMVSRNKVLIGLILLAVLAGVAAVIAAKVAGSEETVQPTKVEEVRP